MKNINRKRIEEFLLGNEYYIKETYSRIYGYEKYDKTPIDITNENKKKYLLIIFFMGILIVFSIFDNFILSDGLYVDENKNVKYIVREESNGIYEFNITLSKDGQTYNKSATIQLEESNDSDNLSYLVEEKDQMDLIVEEIVRNINLSEDEKIALPTKLQDGTSILWNEKKTNNISIYLLMFFLFGFAIYKSRYKKLIEAEEEAIKSVKDNLPIFINKIVLLLNAGMVFESAFLKIIEDYKECHQNVNTYFYSQLITIGDNFNERNYSIHKEIGEFAKRTRVKEFVRVSSIISDNIYKGVNLVDKLESEGEQLWFSHKKQIEEKVRLAETKLVAPLALLLGILVMITVAPAMLEM